MRLIWTEPSEVDLGEMFDYIIEENPTAALSILANIREQAKQLTLFPYSGRPGRVEHTRELVITGTSYLLIYRVTGSGIEILRVWHGARQWPQE